jgi:CBS domain-containing protein
MSQFPLPRIQEFVKRVAPFETLSPDELGEVVSKMDISYYPRGEVVVQSGGSVSPALFIIQSGSVKLSVPDEDGQEILVDIRGEGDTFGALSLLQGKQALLNVTVKEDLVAFILPSDYFLSLLDEHSSFKRHFNFSLARRFRAVRALVDEHLDKITGKESLQEIAAQMRCHVSELMSRTLVTCTPECPVQKAAQKMAQFNVGSIIVKNGAEEPIGLVTDHDLRSKVLAKGLDVSTKVQDIMSSPIISISPGAFVFEAVLEMALRGVHHLVVWDEGRMQGLISDHDVNLITGASPVGLLHEIEKVGSIDKLAKLSVGTHQLLEMLLRMGSSADYMMALMNGFYDNLTTRVLALCEADMSAEGWGQAPCEYSWLFVGEQGRMEQAPPPVMANAMAYPDLEPKPDEQARRWFMELAVRTEAGLERCGLTRTAQGVMASKPQWCKNLMSWKATLRELVAAASTRDLAGMAGLLDFRPASPGSQLTGSLRAFLHERIRQDPRFIRQLARLSIAALPPLGFLRQFVVERDGGYSDRLNLAKRVMSPLTGAVRVMALDAGVMETSTIKRITRLEHSGKLDQQQAGELQETFSYLALAHDLALFGSQGKRQGGLYADRAGRA